MTLTDEEDYLVAQIITLTEDPGAHYWWLHCVRTLGDLAITRAIGNFRELYIDQSRKMTQTKGAVFTGVLKAMASEMNKSLDRQ